MSSYPASTVASVVLPVKCPPWAATICTPMERDGDGVMVPPDDGPVRDTGRTVANGYDSPR